MEEIEPRRKRPKIVRGEDDYMAGNIIEIELHKFMTFDYLKCKPGPRLNLVIGPNGSGKSSLVCAIALGLGGEPQLLGRAKGIGAYVKRGEESGYIKITLREDRKEEHFTIVRKINTNNKSEWLFNGKVVPRKDITDIIQRFNIQVNNLTQFLPQDRVCEFAKLTPVQLLEETEKAVGDPQLPIKHNALVQKSRALKDVQLTVEKNEETLNQLKERNAELEKDVERVRQREELLAKVESMKKKLPWLRYDMKQAEYQKAKEREKDAKKALEEAAKHLQDFSEPIEKQKKKKAPMDAECKKCTNLIDGNSRKRTELMEEANRLGVELGGKYKDMEELRRQEETRQQRIFKTKEELAAAELELQNLPHYEPPTAEIKKLRDEIVALDDSARQMNLKKSEKEKLLFQKKEALTQCTRRLKEMGDKNRKCLHALQKSGVEKIFEAYTWVQEHRDEFNKKVFGPVLLEVNVSNQDHAKFLEGQVAYYIWKSFITQDSGDRDLLVKHLKSFDVPILNHTGNDGHRRDPFEISKDMHDLGIYSRLDQIFDAPTAVKEVLTEQFGLDHSYIGSRETDQKADLVQRLGIFDLWTPDNHYRWSKSRYGNHVSAVVEAVGRPQLLLYNLDVGEIEKLMSQKKELEEDIANLEESYKGFQDEERHLRNEEANLRRQRERILKDAQNAKTRHEEIKRLISQRKQKLEMLEKEVDMDAAMANLIDQVTNCNIQRLHNAIKIKDLLVEAAHYKKSFVEKRMASLELDTKVI
ncbi:hypothetical protein L6164_017934 [Bauhinia variegata]|uniref:Uncharacterized protein n=1 Tax=Bauhinia variegata TaxID=167791 RepID=A0ACB9NBB8_BAUVA|nr:hypothetical protein L6164_017934 [Bauhinia variegata]